MTSSPTPERIYKRFRNPQIIEKLESGVPPIEVTMGGVLHTVVSYVVVSGEAIFELEAL
ncbi:hypothetical protein [Microbacterium oleivorans]|uniref:hypothetical protein n=1 Tax=Microbacterium oleivorans TaxID=273677 RepID=UPI00140469F5|nr:hypothetical protein [Microbacterium oleivorans]